MNLGEVLSISLTAILANRLRSFLTMLGIVIGVTSVILLVSLVTGLKSYITDQISGLGSNLIFVIPGKLGGGRGPGGVQVNKLTLQDGVLLRNKLGSDVEVASVVQKVSNLKFQNKTDNDATIIGTDPNYNKVIKAVTLTEGRFFTISEGSSNRNVAVVGQTVKKNLFNDQSPINQSIQLGGVKFKVIGVMDKRGSTFGIDQDNTMIIPISVAQKQFNIDKVNTIYVSVLTTDKIPVIQEKINQALKKRLSTDDFTIQTQEQTLSTISQITRVLTLGLGGVAGISLVVGGIGIMNIMLVSVTERTREIGLRKALGAKPKDIRNQFLIEATTLSGLGGIIGILLGFGLSFIAGQFLTTSVPLWSIGLSFGFSMFVGIVFGTAPALRAAKLDPILALKYE